MKAYVSKSLRGVVADLSSALFCRLSDRTGFEPVITHDMRLTYFLVTRTKGDKGNAFRRFFALPIELQRER
jgi:hypothetical protein